MTINNLPKGWSEVFLSQFIELSTIDLNEFHSTSSLSMQKISILTDMDIDSDDLEDMDIQEFIDIEKSLKWLDKKPTQSYQKSILDNQFHLIDFNTLTLGAFIDINYYLSNDQITNLPKLFSVLYRKKRYDDWGNEIIEPYSVIDINKRADIMLDCYITDVYGLVLAITEWKTNLIDIYKNLFEPEFDEDEFDEEEEEQPKSFEDLESEKVEQLNSKWGWEQMVYKLANEDIAKMDAIFDLPVIFVFTMMSMKKELGI